MNTNQGLFARTTTGLFAAGALLLAGMASAHDYDSGNGKRHEASRYSQPAPRHDNGRPGDGYRSNYRGGDYRVDYRRVYAPRPIYVQPRAVYVAPRPTYYERPYYTPVYEPAAVYSAPSYYAPPVSYYSAPAATYYSEPGYRCGSNGAATVVGAVAGGLIGNQGSRPENRGAATVIGALAGGVIGNAIDHSSRCYRY
ncbi:MAG: glycine zipper 2TM domain-containing protein [Steroidobacteraceae bacterium]